MSISNNILCPKLLKTKWPHVTYYLQICNRSIKQQFHFNFLTPSSAQTLVSTILIINKSLNPITQYLPQGIPTCNVMLFANSKDFDLTT